MGLTVMENVRGVPNSWPTRVFWLLSAAVVMIMSGLILFDTSRIVNGGETNYIRATVSLYLNIYNLFINLLHLISAFTGGDD